MHNVEIEREHFPSLPDNTAPLWLGFLGAPTVWAIELQTIYTLTPYACAHQRLWLLHLVHIVGLALVVVGGVICLRYWNRRTSDQEDRTRFLASLGLMASSLFFIALLAQTIAGCMLDPCAT